MILSREIIVKINESNFQYFENLGYDISIGDELITPIELLSKELLYLIIDKIIISRIIKRLLSIELWSVDLLYIIIVIIIINKIMVDY